MIPRKEVALFIHGQMKSSVKKKLIPDKYPGSTHFFDVCDAHHYGKCELRELLDLIYGGPPENDEEKL